MYNFNEIASRIKSVAKESNVSLKDLLENTGLGINTISELSKGKAISFLSLACIADYLDISVDYLLGRTEKKLIDKTMSEEEEMLVAAYQAKPEMRSAVRRLLEIPEPTDTKISDNNIASDMIKTVNTLSKSTATKS